MTGPGCPKTKEGKRRKHTPIVSEKQRRLFGAALGDSRKAPSLSKAEARRHLKEAKGKRLPLYKRKKK